MATELKDDRAFKRFVGSIFPQLLVYFDVYTVAETLKGNWGVSGKFRERLEVKVVKATSHYQTSLFCGAVDNEPDSRKEQENDDFQQNTLLSFAKILSEGTFANCKSSLYPIVKQCSS